MVDTGDPEFRRRFHAEVDCPRRRAAGDVDPVGVRLDDVSTDDDLVAALVDDGPAITAAAAMTFIWPTMLGALVLVPVLIGAYVWAQQPATGGPRRSARPGWCSPDAAGAPAGARTSRSRC